MGNNPPAKVFGVRLRSTSKPWSSKRLVGARKGHMSRRALRNVPALLLAFSYYAWFLWPVILGFLFGLGALLIPSLSSASLCTRMLGGPPPQCVELDSDSPYKSTIALQSLLGGLYTGSQPQWVHVVYSWALK